MILAIHILSNCVTTNILVIIIVNIATNIFNPPNPCFMPDTCVGAVELVVVVDLIITEVTYAKLTLGMIQ